MASEQLRLRTQQLQAFAKYNEGSLTFSEAQRLFHQGLHLEPKEEEEEEQKEPKPSEDSWFYPCLHSRRPPWLESSDAELASAPCRLVGLLGFLSLRAVSSHHKLGGIMFCECQ